MPGKLLFIKYSEYSPSFEYSSCCFLSDSLLTKLAFLKLDHISLSNDRVDANSNVSYLIPFKLILNAEMH